MGTQASGPLEPCCVEVQSECVYTIGGGPVKYDAGTGATASGLVHNEHDIKGLAAYGYHTGGLASVSKIWDHDSQFRGIPIDPQWGSSPYGSPPLSPHAPQGQVADANWKMMHHEPHHLPDQAMVQFEGPQGYERLIAATRAKMRSPNEQENATGKNKLYGGRGLKFPTFQTGKHVPTLALINPKSGGKVGTDVLIVARRCPVYQDRFFNINEVSQDVGRGGLLDILRIELNAAKEEARAMRTRPRVISAGGDGTATYCLHTVLLALQANDSRPAEEGLWDTGNGFIWTDEEMRESFPAMAQMPLGSANDFANILGWGQQYPGAAAASCCTSCSVYCAKMTKRKRFQSLLQWIEHVIDPASQVCNFDVWGIMPAGNDEQCNFKLAELGAKRGRNPKTKIDGKKQLTMKEPGKPTPFFVLLYFSTGFGGYLCSRFANNRRTTPFKNRLEYIRQIMGMITESTPPQTNVRTEGVKIDCVGTKGGDGHGVSQAYFPPRRGRKSTTGCACCAGVASGKRYREVGFYNINWQAHALHGADRAPLLRRLFWSKRRRPVKFNDGLLDMYRMRFKSYLKNPGIRMQTDKRMDMTLTYEANQGKGIFVQYDGEARFVFSPTGEQFNIHIRKVLNIPVVIGPYCKELLTGDLKDESPAFFEISGDTPELKQRARMRILKSLQGVLDQELNATAAEITAAKLPLYEAPHDTSLLHTPSPKNPKPTHNSHA